MAKRIEMPRFIKPQLATLRSKAPKGDLWLHEIKYDGYRVQIHLNRGRKTVFTRNGLDWTKRMKGAGQLFLVRENSDTEFAHDRHLRSLPERPTDV